MCINTEIVLARGVIMSNAVPWSTWEELLLAYAVKRHGYKDWDKVAMELQNRRRRHHGSSSPEAAYTAQICRDRYRNLKRRFATSRHGAGENKNDSTGDDGGDGGEDDDAFLWLEELRKLRVAELKQEVHRYDDSIRLLQIKVKTMEEERGRNDDVKQPDLDDDKLKQGKKRSENDKKKPPEHVGGKSVSGGGEEENASFHESNSAGNREASFKRKPAVAKPESGNDSSDTHEIRRKRMTRGDVRVESEETKESSDVQSSASKRKRSKAAEGGGGSGSSAPIKRESGGVKTEPPAVVYSILEKVRAHKHGLVFQRRLQSQKTEKYKKTIRRHVDVETIQAGMDDGSYSSCPTKFYLDLLLLFNNAIVFFPKASAESRAARDLRQLVIKEMKNDKSSLPPQPAKPGSSDSLLARHKYANPIVVCRKRSSISAKNGSSPANKADQKQKNTTDKPAANAKPLAKSPLSTSNDDDDLGKLKIKEKPVTGVRSMRRSGVKGKPNATKTESSTPSIGQSRSVSAQKDEAEASKGDRKKTEAAPAAVKRTGAADFLKRIKKNSPAKASETPKSMKDNTPKGGKKEPPPKKKVDEKRDDGPVRRSAAGASGSGGGRRQMTKEESSGGGRRQTTEESSPAKRTTSTGRPAKEKEVVVFTRKRGKDVEGDGSSQRERKRPRQLRIDED